MATEKTKQPTIREKLQKLEDLTNWFYSDEFTLDEATKKYRSAAELTKSIEDDLENLKNEIEVIDKDFAKE